MVLRIHAVIAPATSRSSQVTGSPLREYATTILPMRSRRSFRSRATARMAISSEPTAMPNLDSIMKPSRRPPMPMMMLRRPCAQKSMTQPISMRFGSMSRRLRPFLASHSSLLFRSCCIRAFRATIARLCAFIMSLISPVRPRENSVIGIRRALPPPAAVPLTFMVGPPEG